MPRDYFPLLILLSALWGASYLFDEAVTLNALLGLALILAGVALGSGALRLRRPATAAAP